MTKFRISAISLALALLFTIPLRADVLFSELVTVTDDSFSLYWATDQPAQCLIKYGARSLKLGSQYRETGKPVAFHFSTITGLHPGTKYYYALVCGDHPAGFSRRSPGTLVTQAPPGGELLFSFAVLTDMHVKEDISGVTFLPIRWAPMLSSGYVWKYPVDNYWAFTNRNAIEQINKQPVSFTVVTGDLTSWFTKEEFELAKSFLDQLVKPYYPMRGNHDRVENQPSDWFKKVFNRDPSYYSFNYQGFCFICLDDSRLSDGWGMISDEEFAWLEKTLAGHKNDPTFIFAHHPDGLGYPDVKKATSDKFQALLGRNPQIVACFYGHKHGAVIRIPKFGGNPIPQIMVPIVKDYPSGFGIVKVYEGGLVYNFHRTDCADCLEWSAVTRREEFGLAPFVLESGLSDRNLAYAFPEKIKRMVGK